MASDNFSVSFTQRNNSVDLHVYRLTSLVLVSGIRYSACVPPSPSLVLEMILGTMAKELAL